MAASAPIRQYIPTRPREGRRQSKLFSWRSTDTVLIGYSYLQSGSSGCLRSHSGRRLRTVGITAKLYSGGGELVDHSSVHASQGSFPAALPRKYDTIRFTTKMKIARAWMNAPIVTTKF